MVATNYLHSKSYIWRNLKVENIYICNDGYIKISGFDFCKKL